MKTLFSLLCGLVSISVTSAVAQDEPLELGSVDLAVSDGWVTVDLSGSLISPIVTSGSITRNDADSVVPEVRNITSDSFDIRIVDWGTAGLHTAVETVSFMAIEEGRHEIGGLIFQAGKKDDFGIISTISNQQTGFQSVYFDSITKQSGAEGSWNYSAFSQIVGEGDTSAIHCRHSITESWTDRLQFRFEQELGDTSSVTVSELHYVIIQAGSGATSNGSPIKSFNSARLYEEIGKDLNYGATFVDPLIFARQPYIYGGDSTSLRITDVTEDRLTMFADESTGWNKKHTTEVASIFVLGAATVDLTVNDLDAADIITETITVTDSISVGGNIDLNGDIVVTTDEGQAVTVNAELLSQLVNGSLNYMPIGGSGHSEGLGSFATLGSDAIGDYAIAMGRSHTEGERATAMGDSAVIGDYTTAMGSSFAVGDYATAMGAGQAYGDYTTGMGAGAADGDYTTAMGRGRANGDYATAMGGGVASGDYTTAMGRETIILSYSATAMGQYNKGIHTELDQWQGDRLNSVLEVGVGTSHTDRKNALTVYQDGSCDIGNDSSDGTAPLVVSSDGSVIITKAQGDISMGAFGTAE